MERGTSGLGDSCCFCNELSPYCFLIGLRFSAHTSVSQSRLRVLRHSPPSLANVKHMGVGEAQSRIHPARALPLFLAFSSPYVPAMRRVHFSVSDGQASVHRPQRT